MLQKSLFVVSSQIVRKKQLDFSLKHNWFVKITQTNFGVTHLDHFTTLVMTSDINRSLDQSQQM